MSDPEHDPKTEPAPAGPEAADDTAPANEAARPDVQPSDGLIRAMAEAVASVEEFSAPPPDAPTPNTDPEVEVEIEPPAPEKKFDPNRVDKVEPAPLPPPPSKFEQELKLQILDLRQQLRDKDKEIEQKIKEIKQNADSARMLAKNFDGYKVRVQREKADQFNYGHEPVMKELLTVVDNLERALHHAGNDPAIAALREGVQMTLNQLLAVLAKFGVGPVPAENCPFNPEFHQAITQIETSDFPPNHVVEVHQKGYRLKDRLLRAAMVIVSKAPAQPAEGGAVEEAPEKEIE
jgi:molecular chaperone GrpE